MKLSIRSRIFIILGILTIASLLVVWMVVYPKYETLAIAERLSAVQQLQTYSIDNLDRAITDWSHDPRVIASQVAERPKEGEMVLRTMMMLHPEIIHIKVQSPKLTDELTSQNTSYSPVMVQIADSSWVPSKLDSLLQIAWINRTEEPEQLFVTQTRFQVQSIPFFLTIVWDAKRLNDIIAGVPLGLDYSVSVQSNASVLVHNTSSFNLNGTSSLTEGGDAIRRIREEATTWHLLTSALHSVQLWIIIAVPEKTITRPVENLMLYSTSLVIGILLLLLVLGWLLSYQTRQPKNTVTTDTNKASAQ